MQSWPSQSLLISTAYRLVLLHDQKLRLGSNQTRDPASLCPEHNYTPMSKQQTSRQVHRVYMLPVRRVLQERGNIGYVPLCYMVHICSMPPPFLTGTTGLQYDRLCTAVQNSTQWHAECHHRVWRALQDCNKIGHALLCYAVNRRMQNGHHGVY